MKKEKIIKKLIEILNVELDCSGLQETDLDFQTYLENKYSILNEGKYSPNCSGCGKMITDKEYYSFKITIGNHEDYDLEHVILDKNCLFKYILHVILERSKRYRK